MTLHVTSWWGMGQRGVIAGLHGAPYSKNMVNLFSFGCHVIDRAYAFTDCTGGVSQECLRKYTSFIFDIHNMVNGQLSKQDSH